MTPQQTANCIRFLEIRQALSRSANAKYAAFARYASAKDQRVRGTTIYHGAATGRNTGSGPQPLNMLRESHDNIDTLIQLIRAKDVQGIEILYGSLANALAVATRQMIMAAPGCTFFCGDYSSIEGRGAAWETNELHILEDYRSGKDPYKVAASNILKIPYDQVTEKQRKAPGKVAELACGYGGGPNAARVFGATGITKRTDDILSSLRSCVSGATGAHYEEWADKEVNKVIAHYGYSEREQKQILTLWRREYCKGYNPLSEELIRLIQDNEIRQSIIWPWRNNRRATVDYWYAVEAAAKKAVDNPGSTVAYGHCLWGCSDGFLYCKLPSGRLLSYYQPLIEEKTQPWGKKDMVLSYIGYKMVDNKPTQWTRVTTWGGKLFENIIQASMRDILREAKFAVTEAGYKIVLDVYDEILAEVPVSENRCLEEFLHIMASVNPPWAEGLPLAAEGWQGQRYRKG